VSDAAHASMVSKLLDQYEQKDNLAQQLEGITKMEVRLCVSREFCWCLCVCVSREVLTRSSFQVLNMVSRQRVCVCVEHSPLKIASLCLCVVLCVCVWVFWGEGGGSPGVEDSCCGACVGCVRGGGPGFETVT
jgi:hypothetical protein